MTIGCSEEVGCKAGVVGHQRLGQATNAGRVGEALSFFPRLEPGCRELRNPGAQARRGGGKRRAEGYAPVAGGIKGDGGHLVSMWNPLVAGWVKTSIGLTLTDTQ